MSDWQIAFDELAADEDQLRRQEGLAAESADEYGAWLAEGAAEMAPDEEETE